MRELIFVVLDIYFKNGSILKNVKIGIKIAAGNYLDVIEDEYVIRNLLDNRVSSSINTNSDNIDFTSNICRGSFNKSEMLKYEIKIKKDNFDFYHTNHISNTQTSLPDNAHFITYRDTSTKLPPIAYFFHGYRLKHSLGVSNLMKKVLSYNKGCFSEEEESLLQSSALYHEIGYSDKAKYLDFYPLDGSIYIYHTTNNKMLSTILKYHSFAEALVPENLKIHYEYNTLSLNNMLKEMVDLLTLCDVFVEQNGAITTNSIMEKYHNLINLHGENDVKTLIFKENMPSMYKTYDKYNFAAILKSYVNA
jgi:hypothetical protein